jgi:uncharacterized membrane protein
MLGFRLENRSHRRQCKKKTLFRGPCEHRHNFHFLFLGSKYMYICSRCLGLYGGFFFFSFFTLLFKSLIHYFQSLNPFLIFFVCFFLTIPLVFDWLTQSRGLRHSTNKIRFLTGLMTSFSGVILIIAYQALWLTVPLGLFWFYVVVTQGHRWRVLRSSSFGCYACRGELLEAITVQEISNENM